MSLLPKVRSTPTATIKNKLFFIHGEPKSGKTTYAATFPHAVFAATEPGHNFVDVFKVDIDGWEKFRSMVAELIKGQGKDHEFETVIIDTVDNLYAQCTQFVLKREGVQHESELAYGKGYHLVRDEFKKVINALGIKGFGIVFLSHSQEKDIETKTKKITRIDSTLGSTAKKFVTGLCDFIFYVYQDEEQNRWLVTKGSESLNAGDRSGVLPKLIPLSSFDELDKIYINAKKEGKK